MIPAGDMNFSPLVQRDTALMFTVIIPNSILIFLPFLVNFANDTKLEAKLHLKQHKYTA